MTGVSIYLHATTLSFFKDNILTEIKQEFKEEHISQFAIAIKLYFEISLQMVSSQSMCKHKCGECIVFVLMDMFSWSFLTPAGSS